VIATLKPHLAEVAPVARRAVALDANAIVRLRAAASSAARVSPAADTTSSVSLFVTLPFKVLVSRTVPVDAQLAPADITIAGADLLEWLERGGPEPAPRDAQWRGALPPQTGWRRLEVVPDDVIRPLIRAGALALKEAAAREGVPGAEPRAEVSDALLDSIVLTVSDDAGHSAGIALRTVSSLVRMGFVPRGSAVSVDVSGRWTRLGGEFGSAYFESPGGLQLR
jgi:hypothetical protein